MNGVTQEQRDAILTKAEALAGEPLGEAGALLRLNNARKGAQK